MSIAEVMTDTRFWWDYCMILAGGKPVLSKMQLSCFYKYRWFERFARFNAVSV
jgi:hypothetical protein